MIAIIDYGSGNPGSVSNMLDYLKVDNMITDNIDKILKSDAIILPGVGSFGDCIRSLDNLNLKEPLKIILKNINNYILKGYNKKSDINDSAKASQVKKFLGICVGMQILFEKSEESQNIKGLGIFRGNVLKFNKGKIPQIGWNNVTFKDKSIDDYYYFVNSYYTKPVDKSIIFGESDYNGKFVSAIRQGNITAVQFHVEKSGVAGINFFKRWLKC